MEPPRRQGREENRILGVLRAFAVKNFQQHSTGRLSKREAGIVNGKNRPLVVVVAILTASIVLTGGLAVYLTVARGGGAVGRAAGEPAGTAAAPAEPRIAFLSDEQGGLALYVMDVDGSDVQRVSEPGLDFALFLAWSPDGRRVAYMGSMGDPFRERVTETGVWVSSAGGTEHVRASLAITTVLGIAPAWSPDGTRLAFAARGERSGEGDPTSVLYVVRADGSGIERSVPLPWTVYDLDWSPTAEAWLLVGGSPDAESGVHVLSGQEDGGEEMVELYDGALAADWSPDGSQVVVGDYQARTLLVLERDQEPRQVAQLPLQPLEVAWSPDGTRVAVAVAGSIRQGYSTGLYVLTLETGELTTVARDEGLVGWPAWSPDGQRLLFTVGPLRQRTGTELPYANLWTYELASGTLEQLTLGEGFMGLGAWSP
jgi:Tol biopolymer transport system component